MLLYVFVHFWVDFLVNKPNLPEVRVVIAHVYWIVCIWPIYFTDFRKNFKSEFVLNVLFGVLCVCMCVFDWCTSWIIS